jgi:hypothetical protein
MLIGDFKESSLVGTALFRVQRVISQRLNTKVASGTTRNYINNLRKISLKHRLIEKLGDLHIQYTKRKDFKQKLNKLDRLS